jgi:serine/threonine protein kinase
MIVTSLTHYRITVKPGQGGTGEVYRAQAANLSRQVAIKVLPDQRLGVPPLAMFREAGIPAGRNARIEADRGASSRLPFQASRESGTPGCRT